MNINYEPAKINVFKEFSVIKGEIRLKITNPNDETMYIPRYGIIRNADYLPIGKVNIWHPELTLSKNGSYEIPADLTISDFTFEISQHEFELADAGYEYTICIQAEPGEYFAWTDTIIDCLKKKVFQASLSDSDESQEDDETQTRYIAKTQEIARQRPGKILSIPMHLRILSECSETLCLDFGSSYSVCASYVPGNLIKKNNNFNTKLQPNKINYTIFSDNDRQDTKIVPTCLLLKKYQSGAKTVEWAFGYKAEKIAKENRGKATFIIRIKQLLSDLDKKKDCRDIEGNGRDFTYEEILQTYLDYLVKTSKKFFGLNFKRIHITTPVRYTHRQMAAYKKILTHIGFEEKNILSKLDEAKSPLYHFITDKIDAYARDQQLDTRFPNQSTGYFIIDCGGGSIDATHISGLEVDPGMKIEKSKRKRANSIVKLRFQGTKVEGNSKFGGMTLTDYLFKYIKLKICYRLLKKDLGETGYLIDTILPYIDNDIFYHLYEIEQKIKKDEQQYIAKKQSESVYADFNKYFDKLETYLPSNIDNFQDRDRITWDRVQDNYTLLWQLAESIKVNIYSNDAPKTLPLNAMSVWNSCSHGFWMNLPESDGLEDQRQKINKLDLNFENYELNKLYRPIIFIEITRLIRNLQIEPSALMGEKSSLYVRFVGQTTRIPLFDEALGYYLPRMIIEKENREHKGASRFASVTSEEKKLCTASGAAHYLRHITAGKVRDENFIENEILLHDIWRFEDDGETPRELLLERNTPVNKAEDIFFRPLADVNEEHFGTVYDEQRDYQGKVVFEIERITKCLPEEDLDKLSEQYDEFRDLQYGEDADMIIMVKVKNIDSSQKLEFYPYIRDKDDNYYTTEHPEELKFQSS